MRTIDEVIYGEKSICGPVRSENEDTYICIPEIGFFLVSDGMGGLPGGADTAKVFADAMKNRIENAYEIIRSEVSSDKKVETAAKVLLNSVKELSQIFYLLGNVSGRNVYGATVVAVWFVNDKAIIVNAGDSKAFEITCKGISQISKTHNLAEVMVELGQLSKEDAQTHPAANQLVQFIGCNPKQLDPYLFIANISDGDEILLCTDGLSNHVSEKELYDLAVDNEPEDAVEKMVQAAVNNDSHDNITAVLIKCVLENVNDDSNGD